jgi:HK97 family phage major capsid protein/HK97 family phage prohead protease
MTAPARGKPARLRSSTFEFRAADPTSGSVGDGRTLDGYAAVFNVPTEIDSWEGTFQEVVAPGAFKRTLKQRGYPVMQFDHGNDTRTGSVPIGVYTAITEEDSSGLHVIGRLFDNPVVEPIRQAVEGKAITGMSIKFRVVDDVWTDNAGKKLSGEELWDLLWTGGGERGPILRTIREVELFECGPVVFPAYEETSVGVRSMLDRLTDEQRAALVRDLTQELRGDTDRPQAEPDTEPAADEAAAAADGADNEPPQTTEPAGNGTSERKTQEPAKPGTSATPSVREARSTAMPEVRDDRMTVEERAARQSEIRARLSEIDQEFSGGALPEETQTEWDSLQREFDEHDTAIEAAQTRAAQLRRFADNDRATEKVDGVRSGYGAGNNSRRPSVGTRRQIENIYDLAEVRRQASSIDELPELYRDRAMRAIEQGRYPGVDSRESAQGQAEKLLNSIDDKNATLARRVLVTGSPTYARAFGKAVMAANTAGLTAEEQRALSLGVDGSGGYAVPFQLDPTVILTNDGVVNPLRQVARVEQIVGKEWDGVTSAGITVSRAAEGDEASDNSPTLTQPTVRAKRVQAFVPFSMELEQDWASLQGEITRLLADAKDVEETTAFTLGDGTGNNPNGLIKTLASSSHVAQTGAAGSFSIPADVFAVEEALGPRFRARASWLANKSVYNKIRTGAIASAAYAGDLWVRLAGNVPPLLNGYDARELSAMDSTIEASGGAANLILAFGDFKTGFLIVDRIGMNVELVPHLFGSANRYPTGQRGIYVMWRNNSKVLADNAIRVLNVTSAA